MWWFPNCLPPQSATFARDPGDAARLARLEEEVAALRRDVGEGEGSAGAVPEAVRIELGRRCYVQRLLMGWRYINTKHISAGVSVPQLLGP